jgi:hypothetical protein
MFQEQKDLYMNENQKNLQKANEGFTNTVSVKFNKLLEHQAAIESALLDVARSGIYVTDTVAEFAARKIKASDYEIRDALVRLTQRGELEIRSDWTVVIPNNNGAHGSLGAAPKEDFDPVNKPKHYASGKIQPIEAIEDWGLGYNLGNCIKYLSRAGKKDKAKEKEDLQKALFYLSREIANLDKKK